MAKEMENNVRILHPDTRKVWSQTLANICILPRAIAKTTIAPDIRCTLPLRPLNLLGTLSIKYVLLMLPSAGI